MQSYVIKTLIRMLESKELVLPAMQRPFVWEEERILRLMDSLLRRFLLSTIVVRATSEGQRSVPSVPMPDRGTADCHPRNRVTQCSQVPCSGWPAEIGDAASRTEGHAR